MKNKGLCPLSAASARHKPQVGLLELDLTQGVATLTKKVQISVEVSGQIA